MMWVVILGACWFAHLAAGVLLNAIFDHYDPWDDALL